MASEKKEKEKKEYAGGAPTMEAVNRFGEQVEKAKQSPYMIVDPVLDIPGSENLTDKQKKVAIHAANVGKYPIRPLPKDPYDTYYQIKQDLAEQGTEGGQMQQGFGAQMANTARPIPWTEEDIQYLKRKRDAEENASFLTWQANKYNLNDPATRDWFEKRNPSFFKMRESLIEEQIDLASRYAKIRLRGAKTEDDLKLQYFVETERISLPKGPLWDPYRWIEAEADVLPTNTSQEVKNKILDYNEKSYRKGLWNPVRVMTPEKGGLIVNPYNKGDIAGYPETHYTGIYGTQVSASPNYKTAYGGKGLVSNRIGFNNTFGEGVIERNKQRQAIASRAAFAPANYTINVAEQSGTYY